MNISHYFCDKPLYEEVNIAWESGSGERFHIIANKDPCRARPQYDLFIDGCSFFSLPLPSQLRAVSTNVVASEMSCSSKDDDKRMQNVRDVEPPTFYEEKLEETDVEGRNARLVMAGLAPSSKKARAHDYLEDELTAKLVTNHFDSLRRRVTAMIPEVEDIVSQAIINAFSEDGESLRSSSPCSLDSTKPPAINIEVSSLWDALSWMDLHVDCASPPEMESRKRLFLQKQVNAIFLHVHRESLSQDAAILILCNISKLLGLEPNLPLRKDTILLRMASCRVGEKDVLYVLRSFGEISEAAMSEGRTFGIFRFRDELGAVKVLAASATGTFFINGEAPLISQVEYQPLRKFSPLLERAQSDPSPLLSKPLHVRRRSHQRNTITIDRAMASAPFLTVDEDLPLISPIKSKSLSQTDKFVNLGEMTSSSQASSPVFDSPFESQMNHTFPQPSWSFLTT